MRMMLIAVDYYFYHYYYDVEVDVEKSMKLSYVFEKFESHEQV